MIADSNFSIADSFIANCQLPIADFVIAKWLLTFCTGKRLLKIGNRQLKTIGNRQCKKRKSKIENVRIR